MSYYNPEYHREYYKKHKQKILKRAIKWQQTNKEQHNKHVTKYSKQHPEVAKTASQRYFQRNKGTLRYVQNNMLIRARSRAKQKNYPFDLTISDIKNLWPENNRCPVLGIEFDLSGKDIQRCASLDKIIPERGYVKGNVIIISYRANSIKQDASLTEIKAVLEFFSKVIID